MNNKTKNRKIKNQKKDSTDNSIDKRTDKRKIGDLGENIATEFLMKHQYTVIERNYLKKYGEIDIIAKKGDKYHFIEVKSVSRVLSFPLDKKEAEEQYRPEENIHPWKMRRLTNTIQAYIVERKLFDADWQCDAITVSIDHTRRIARLEVLKNIIL